MSSCFIFLSHRRAQICGALIAAVLSQASRATADDHLERAIISAGEVVGNNVYVRSGPSENHYVICKLNAGSRVTIVGDRGGQGEWLEILPPAGVFSLIAGEYVDSVDKKEGVVNAESVNVRAGSLLNGNKYTVQTKLTKGAEVRIIGENPDGFLRIAPPRGATVWITRQYVEMVPGSGLSDEAGEPDPVMSDSVITGSVTPDRVMPNRAMAKLGEPDIGETVDAVPAPVDQVESGNETYDSVGRFATDRHTSDTSFESSAIDLDPQPLSPFYMMESTPQRAKIEQIDAALKAEFKKSLLQRDLDPIVARYRAVANQREDEVARRYAEGRLLQLDNMAELRSAVDKLRELDGQAEAVRRKFLSERAGIMEPPLVVPVDLDARGELRQSAVFQGTAGPRRYRLVDTTFSPGRTVGFVEIPLDAQYDVAEYLGRYIGVRARTTKLLADGVNPMPVYVASELVVLEAPSGLNDAAATPPIAHGRP